MVHVLPIGLVTLVTRLAELYPIVVRSPERIHQRDQSVLRVIDAREMHCPAALTVACQLPAPS